MKRKVVTPREAEEAHSMSHIPRKKRPPNEAIQAMVDEIVDRVNTLLELGKAEVQNFSTTKGCSRMYKVEFSVSIHREAIRFRTMYEKALTKSTRQKRGIFPTAAKDQLKKIYKGAGWGAVGVDDLASLDDNEEQVEFKVTVRLHN